MSNTMDRMKKIIEDKKKKSAQQGIGNETLSNKTQRNQEAFKNTKRGGALNK